MVATKKRWIIVALAGVFLLPTLLLYAHPMPNSVVLLSVHQRHISGRIQMPLSELQSAIGLGINQQPKSVVSRLGDTLRGYLLRHVRPVSFDGKPWQVSIGAMHVASERDSVVGQYNELVVDFEMTPPPHADLRNFYFDYDAIVHQVITHKILVAIKQDWERGVLTSAKPSEVGVIELDIPSGRVRPFQVSLQQGSAWRGFQKMFALGQHHIAEGTDHLLFLLTLLLPATLLIRGRNGANFQGLSKVRWGAFGGVKYSLLRLLSIVTAFTIGHSLTLLLAATKLVNLPAQPIEILIAFSILVSAIHAYRPIFSGKEVWLAAGFGLIHGLAFAETLVDLDLELKPLLLSILGFNLGIEFMQLCIVVLTIPWLILLSQTQLYSPFRVVGALGVSVAALAWIVERISGQANFLTEQTEKIAAYPLLCLGLLAIGSTWAYLSRQRNLQRSL